MVPHLSGEPARHSSLLASPTAKLYHLGLHGKVSRSALADANESRDWRIYGEFAQALIRIARRLYAHEPLGIDLDETVYALDSTMISLCLSLFPWAHFRKTEAAVKLHTLLDLRGGIPSFIHISEGRLHDVNVLDLLIAEAGAFYVMDRGYLDWAWAIAVSLSPRRRRACMSMYAAEER